MTELRLFYLHMYYNSTKMMMMNYIYKVGNGNENVQGLYFFLLLFISVTKILVKYRMDYIMGQYIFASQVSNSYTRISPLADLVSVYIMCLEISGHPIRLHVTNNMKNKMTVCLVIFKHPTMIFCLDSISPILLVYFANNVIFFSNKFTFIR